MRTINAQTAKAILHGSDEVAFLDVREHGPYGWGHPLLAVWCPYSRLEILVPSLVPNPRVRIILIDGGDGIAERAASRLGGLGYEDVAVIDGGADGWARAGFTLFEGEYVPSKTLGEMAERTYHPATIDAQTLAEWKADGKPHLLIDVRPPPEHRKMTVPGARCLPNGELPHRFAAALSDPALPVVLTCAGRTRSLVGVASLKLLGIPNPVYGLENGTQGWTLAGLALERGKDPDELPALSALDLETSRDRAGQLAKRAGIPWIRSEDAPALLSDATRTTYLLDVRSAEEFHAGHLPGAVHAPCVQIVQATDRWIGVRRARVILCDDTGLRATIAAFWLKQMGYEVCVLPDTDAAHESWSCSSRSMPGFSPPAMPRIVPKDAAAGANRQEILLLDLRPSVDYRAEHPQGSRWAVRPILQDAVGDWRGGIGILADDERIASLAGIDLREMGCADVRLADGGWAAWKAAGLSTETGWPDPAVLAIDFLSFVHDRHDGNLEAARQYLAWETGLVARLDEQERASFLIGFPA